MAPNRMKISNLKVRNSSQAAAFFTEFGNKLAGDWPLHHWDQPPEWWLASGLPWKIEKYRDRRWCPIMALKNKTCAGRCKMRGRLLTPTMVRLITIRRDWYRTLLLANFLKETLVATLKFVCLMSKIETKTDEKGWWKMKVWVHLSHLGIHS